MAKIYTENSIQGAVYDTLKRGIMTLQLVPGSVMSTQEMATRLNVSRTPVREAFIRLEREGLVVAAGQRGTMVSKIDLKRVEEERFIRESLELAVVEPFLKSCDAAHFTAMRNNIVQQKDCCREKRFADFVDCDNQWHKLLFDAAGQSLAWDTIMNVNSHYNRIRVLTVQNTETIIGVIRQHEKIIKLMERAEKDSVRAEIANHVMKINFEKTDLIRQHPDYFSTGSETAGIRIGTL